MLVYIAETHNRRKKDESMSEPWKTLTMINIRGRSESLYKRIENFVLIDDARKV